jgi:hypothetical protein
VSFLAMTFDRKRCRAWQHSPHPWERELLANEAAECTLWENGAADAWRK